MPIGGISGTTTVQFDGWRKRFVVLQHRRRHREVEARAACEDQFVQLRDHEEAVEAVGVVGMRATVEAREVQACHDRQCRWRK